MSEKEIEVTTLPDTIMVGLLGVMLTNEDAMAVGSTYINSLRLSEVERRILAIESELGMLNPGGQFRGGP